MRYFLIVILTTCISMACIAQDAGDQIDPARVAEAQANLEAKEQARKAATRPATAPSPAQGANVTSDDTAKKKYEAAKAAAEEAFNNAMLAADQQYLNDLNSALKQALANQDVDAVRRIDDERKAAASDLTALQSLRLNGPGKRTALAPPSTVHRVIYLCDGSGSLVGGKDQALEKELNEGVSSLDVSQMFNVVIFQENKPNQ
jgi:multidrug efflux pump subunit AcrA (membrane-fusion protein)